MSTREKCWAAYDGEHDCDDPTSERSCWWGEDAAPGMSARDLLDIQLDERNASDSDKETLGGFLVGMIDLDEKRPYGNSGWHYGLYAALIKAGKLRGTIDPDGDPIDFDRNEANALLAKALDELKGLFK